MSRDKITISRASSITRVSPHLLKTWEKQFSAFFEIPRDRNNSRNYTKADIETVKKIKEMKENKVEDEMIIKLLELQMNPPASNPVEIKPELIESLITDEDIEIPEDTGERTSVDSSEEIVSSLSKMVSFIESKEVKELLKVDTKLKDLEKNIVHQLHEIVHEEIATASDAHTSMNHMELSSISEKVERLANVSTEERISYRTEAEQQRKLIEEKIALREERFIALVQERFRKEVEEPKHKPGMGFLKNILGFAK
ncbi:MerR family transcriptional regulator [Pseudalkalibacillus caeni]|nr:MerR family transcriptional regulator [Pseudalkalibacillus caeni]